MSLDITNNYYLASLDKEKPVVIALSGGVDSMVLFYLLRKANFKVVIAHVNHHKREESKIEEKYLRSLAKELNLKIEVLDYFHEGDNFQAEAHKSRYDFFYKVAKKYKASALITAHHAEDNLETIIMNLMKGSNLYGYGGIKEDTLYQDLRVIRPLIKLTKKQIYDYAKQENITYFEDSSNQSDLYLRNRIRHHIIPLMLEENPNLYESIMNYSNQVFGAFNLIRSKTIAFLKGENKFSVLEFLKLDIVLRKDILNYLFEQNNLTSSENKINDCLLVIENSKPNLIYDLGNDYHLVKAYDEVSVELDFNKEEIYEELNKYDSIVINNYGNFFFRREEPKNQKLSLKVSLNEAFPLIIRTRKYGDKLIIGEGHKKLKDFLIDKKVPLKVRDKLLVVTNKYDEIIWVLGYYKKKCDEKDALNFIFEPKEDL